MFPLLCLNHENNWKASCACGDSLTTPYEIVEPQTSQSAAVESYPYAQWLLQALFIVSIELSILQCMQQDHFIEYSKGSHVSAFHCIKWNYP